MVFNRDEKLFKLSKYSNIDIVSDNVDKLLRHTTYDGENILLEPSTRKKKKYMIKGEFTNYKWVHFGEMGYEDYTKHNNTIKKIAFLNRNNQWINRAIYTPAFLSYCLLWQKYPQATPQFIPIEIIKTPSK